MIKNFSFKIKSKVCDSNPAYASKVQQKNNKIKSLSTNTLKIKILHILIKACNCENIFFPNATFLQILLLYTPKIPF
jgi:hypothetical protein